MGLLNLFTKPKSVALMRLPSGSFTMDRNGKIIVTTLASNFPRELLQDMGQTMIDTFADARKAGLPLDKLVVQYGSLRVSARELSGGTIVFFSPVTPISIHAQN